jgi:hypothetical protein
MAAAALLLLCVLVVGVSAMLQSMLEQVADDGTVFLRGPTAFGIFELVCAV